MIRTRRTDKRSGDSGCFVPIAASAAVADAPFPASWPMFCPGTPLRLPWYGAGWWSCWRDFHSRRRWKNCDCPLRWKRWAGCATAGGGDWIRFAPGFVGSNHRLPAAIPIPCCKPWNICGGSLPPGSVRRLIFSFIFNILSWVEAPLGEGFFAELPPPRFPRRKFRAGDNTTMRCHSTPDRW